MVFERAQLEKESTTCGKTSLALVASSLNLQPHQGKRTATHCNTLQHAATHCNTLQHAATRCNTLQHAAAHCNILHHAATHWTLQFTTAHYHTLKHTCAVAYCKSLPRTNNFSLVDIQSFSLTLLQESLRPTSPTLQPHISQKSPMFHKRGLYVLAEDAISDIRVTSTFRRMGTYLAKELFISRRRAVYLFYLPQKSPTLRCMCSHSGLGACQRSYEVCLAKFANLTRKLSR